MNPYSTATAILDRLPAAVRHAVLMFGAALLTWAAAEAQGIIITDNPIATGLASSAAVSLVGSATLWFTRLTKQYGVGAGE